MWFKAYTPYFIRCLFLTSLSMIFGMLAWGGMFLIASSSFSRNFSFPSDQEIVIDFSTHLTLSEDMIKKEPLKKTYFIEGTLVGIPRPFKGAINYKFTCKSFSIRNEKKHLIIAFEANKEEQRYLYRTDPVWSEEQRLAIFKAFSIDLENTLSSNDNSVFRQTFSLHINNKGEIREIALPSMLRNHINSALNSLSTPYLSKVFFANSHTLPALFPPKGKSQEDSWTTKNSSLTFTHKITKTDKHIISVTTQIQTNPKEDRENSRSFQSAGKLLWTYDKNSKKLLNMHCSLDSTSFTNFFGNTSGSHYCIETKLQPSFIPHLPLSVPQS